jgi:predicted nuclease of predicted toxin-antitoxin system
VSLLLDENVSWRLLSTLEPLFAGSVYVGHVGLAQGDDRAIWSYARTHALAIVTQDADFVDLVRLHGTPPKVIWLRTGNTSTAALRHLFTTHAVTIRRFLDEPALDWMLLA